MTKKNKILIGFLVLVTAIIFVIFYFKDDTNTDVVEEEQVESIEMATDSMFNVLNDEEFDFEEVEDSVILDSL